MLDIGLVEDDQVVPMHHLEDTFCHEQVFKVMP